MFILKELTVMTSELNFVGVSVMYIIIRVYTGSQGKFPITEVAVDWCFVHFCLRCAGRKCMCIKLHIV